MEKQLVKTKRSSCTKLRPSFKLFSDHQQKLLKAQLPFLSDSQIKGRVSLMWARMSQNQRNEYSSPYIRKNSPSPKRNLPSITSKVNNNSKRARSTSKRVLFSLDLNKNKPKLDPSVPTITGYFKPDVKPMVCEVNGDSLDKELDSHADDSDEERNYQLEKLHQQDDQISSPSPTKVTTGTSNDGPATDHTVVTTKIQNSASTRASKGNSVKKKERKGNLAIMGAGGDANSIAVKLLEVPSSEKLTLTKLQSDSDKGDDNISVSLSQDSGVCLRSSSRNFVNNHSSKTSSLSSQDKSNVLPDNQSKDKKQDFPRQFVTANQAQNKLCHGTDSTCTELSASQTSESSSQHSHGSTEPRQHRTRLRARQNLDQSGSQCTTVVSDASKSSQSCVGSLSSRSVTPLSQTSLADLITPHVSDELLAKTIGRVQRTPRKRTKSMSISSEDRQSLSRVKKQMIEEQPNKKQIIETNQDSQQSSTNAEFRSSETKKHNRESKPQPACTSNSSKKKAKDPMSTRTSKRHQVKPKLEFESELFVEPTPIEKDKKYEKFGKFGSDVVTDKSKSKTKPSKKNIIMKWLKNQDKLEKTSHDHDQIEQTELNILSQDSQTPLKNYSRKQIKKSTSRKLTGALSSQDSLPADESCTENDSIQISESPVNRLHDTIQSLLTKKHRKCVNSDIRSSNISDHSTDDSDSSSASSMEFFSFSNKGDSSYLTDKRNSSLSDFSDNVESDSQPELTSKPATVFNPLQSILEKMRSITRKGLQSNKPDDRSPRIIDSQTSYTDSNSATNLCDTDDEELIDLDLSQTDDNKENIAVDASNKRTTINSSQTKNLEDLFQKFSSPCATDKNKCDQSNRNRRLLKSGAPSNTEQTHHVGFGELFKIHR